MSTDITRQIVLDIETTGINKFGSFYKGHKIIEIGAVEMLDRRLTGKNFHIYIQPDRLVEPEAFKIHGISNKFLADKPRFVDIVDELFSFINGSELIIHNAKFDVGFIDYECSMLDHSVKPISSICTIIDTLQLARKIFPGKRNSLDVLCERYLVDNSKRVLHNALLDAEILASVFLLMTGGQTTMQFVINNNINRDNGARNITAIDNLCYIKPSISIIYANTEEMLAHECHLDVIQKQYGYCLWRDNNNH